MILRKFKFLISRHVECLHTGGGLFGDGIGAAICDADFFPNGGSSQPGCWFSGCDHSRSVELYVESIDINGFHAIRCQTEAQAQRENCASGGGFWYDECDLNRHQALMINNNFQVQFTN